jgi:mannose-1-phosphate guanylyltransferase/mannose-6-phosphate isomerase-like protein (cupin superfamily)
MVNIRPVLLAGGEGRRLYPLSTPARPKPFIPLKDGASLLEHSVRRLPEAWLPPVLVGRGQDRYALMNHARQAGVTPAHILLEPACRNTGFAVAAAVRFLQHQGEAAGRMLAVLPSDHQITAPNHWQEALACAAEFAAEHQALTLVGMAFESFSPQLGYFTCDGARVMNFLEKPASCSTLTGGMVWQVNSGQFVAPLGVMARLIETHAPGIWQAAGEAVAARKKSWEFEELSVPLTPFVPESFDRAVVACAPEIYAASCAPCGWSDLGTVESWHNATGITAAMDAKRPRRTDRPWGYYETLRSTPHEITKRLYVFPGGRLSKQRHWQRDEDWEVVSGVAYAECAGQKRQLATGDTLHIAAGNWHRLVNAGAGVLIMHERQSGQPSEADIERIEDDYGRV